MAKTPVSTTGVLLLTVLLFVYPRICSAQQANFTRATLIDYDGDTLSGLANLTPNAELRTTVVFTRLSAGGGFDRLSPRDIRTVTFEEADLTFLSVPSQSEVTKSIGPGEALAFGQLVYSNSLFDVVWLTEAPSFQTNNLDLKVDFRVVVIDKSSGIFYGLTKVVERRSETEYLVRKPYKGKLSYLLRDWKRSEAKIKRLRFTVRAIVELLKEHALVKGYQESSDYQYNFSQPVDRTERHLVRAGFTPGGITGFAYGNSFTVGYERSITTPRRNRIQTHYGLEYSRANASDNPTVNGFTVNYADVANLKIRLTKDVVTTPGSFRLGLAFGISNYIARQRGSIGIFETVPPNGGGAPTPIRVGDRVVSQTSISPLVLNFGADAIYHRVYAGIFVETDVLNGLRGENIFPLGFRLGYYLDGGRR